MIARAQPTRTTRRAKRPRPRAIYWVSSVVPEPSPGTAAPVDVAVTVHMSDSATSTPVDVAITVRTSDSVTPVTPVATAPDERPLLANVDASTTPRPTNPPRRTGTLDSRPRPEDQRRVVAHLLLDVLTRTQLLSTRLHAESARSLSRLHEAQTHRKAGFTSFGDFSRELLGLAHGTVKDRLKLHEVLSASEAIATSLSRGELSESKAIALLPVARIGLSDEAAAGWIAAVREMGVRQLRAAVRDALRRLDKPEDTAEEQDAGEDVEGQTVSFRGPVPVVRMFDSAIETGRKVLGRNAPRYECVEAMLAETSSVWQRMEPDLEERLERASADAISGTASASSDHAPSTSPAEAVGSADAPGDHGSDPAHPAAAGTPIRSMQTKRDPAHAVDIILVPRLDRALLNEALRTAERIEREVAEIAELIGTDDSDYETADPHSRPMAIEAGVRSIESSSLRSLAPSAIDLQSQIDRIVALEQLDAPLRIYRAEILQTLRDSGAISSLGFSSWASFAQDHLGLSDRSTRSLVAEGRLFSLDTALRAAYGRGEIPIGKAFLLRRIAGSGRVADQIDRASAVTHRQLAREVRLIEWARQLGARLSLSRSAEEMEETLLLSLCRWGWTRDRVCGLLDSVGLARPSMGDQAPGGRTVRDGSADKPVDTVIDPATDPGVMNRLERLIDLLILTIWDEPPQCTEDRGPDDPQHESASDDRRTSTHANSSMEVRFWAPDSVAHDWRTALARIRQQNGIGCPPWVAVSMLVAEAMQEWERQDPKKVPTEEKILSRDGYRCMVPGCSSRRGLEVHHVHFLSRGGSDEADNKASLCHGHHRMLHDGVIRVTGRAPHDLYWELGCRPDGPPLMRLKGDRIIAKCFGR